MSVFELIFGITVVILAVVVYRNHTRLDRLENKTDSNFAYSTNRIAELKKLSGEFGAIKQEFEHLKLVPNKTLKFPKTKTTNPVTKEDREKLRKMFSNIETFPPEGDFEA